MATPSPSPLTPTPPSTAQHIVLSSFENIPSPNNNIQNELSPFNYLEMYSSQQSPVKLTPLSEDLALDFCSAGSVTPLKTSVNTRQFIKTRKCCYFISLFVLSLCCYFVYYYSDSENGCR